MLKFLYLPFRLQVCPVTPRILPSHTWPLSLSLSGNTQISLQDTVIPYVPNSIGMLPKQASFLLLLVTLKSFYLPLSSHSVPVNPAKQEHVYPAAILFFVASVHVPPF